MFGSDINSRYVGAMCRFKDGKVAPLKTLSLDMPARHNFSGLVTIPFAYYVVLCMPIVRIVQCFIYAKGSCYLVLYVCTVSVSYFFPR